MSKTFKGDAFGSGSGPRKHTFGWRIPHIVEVATRYVTEAVRVQYSYQGRIAPSRPPFGRHTVAEMQPTDAAEESTAGPGKLGPARTAAAGDP